MDCPVAESFWNTLVAGSPMLEVNEKLLVARGARFVDGNSEIKLFHKIDLFLVNRESKSNCYCF